jgi:DNA-binding transcriptional ArsR family regulator
MKRGRELVAIFGKCSRLINKIVLEVGDDFFTQLYLENSDFLMSEFIIFLENSGTTSGKNNVAQYTNYLKLSWRIDTLIDLIKISKHLNFIGVNTPLSLERSLLVFKLAILDFLQKKKDDSKEGLKSEKIVGNNDFEKTVKIVEPDSFDETAKKILEIVKKQPGLTLKEVNNLLTDLSRRTMERKLRDLIGLGFIRRDKKDGKKILVSIQ